MIAIIGPLRALRACGRFIVTIRTCPRSSTRACGCSSSAEFEVIAGGLLSSAKGLCRTITRSSFIPMALNIADLFEHAADAVPERLALVCGDAEINYRELEARSNQVAHYLAGGGVGPGDHVGIYGRNSIELVETILACYKLRAIPVNVNYRYVEAELSYLFDE